MNLYPSFRAVGIQKKKAKVVQLNRIGSHAPPLPPRQKGEIMRIGLDTHQSLSADMALDIPRQRKRVNPTNVISINFIIIETSTYEQVKRHGTVATTKYDSCVAVELHK